MFNCSFDLTEIESKIVFMIVSPALYSLGGENEEHFKNLIVLYLTIILEQYKEGQILKHGTDIAVCRDINTYVFKGSSW